MRKVPVVAVFVIALVCATTSRGALPPLFATLIDPARDAATATAPDLTGLSFGYTGVDSDVFDVIVDYAGDSLPPGSRIVVGLDTDLNAATGSNRGADYLIDLEPNGDKVAASFQQWRGGSYQPFEPPSGGFSAAKGGSVLLALCRYDLEHPSAFRAFAVSEAADVASVDAMPDEAATTVDVPLVVGVRWDIPLPIAGRPFSVGVQGIRLGSDRKHLIRPQSATCRAKLAGKLLPVTGACRWRLPAGTKGKQLDLSVTVVYDGGDTTFHRSYTVEG